MYPKNRFLASKTALRLLKASVKGHASLASQLLLLLLLLLIWSSARSLRGIKGPLLLMGTVERSQTAT
jgi:hypothetical protein